MIESKATRREASQVLRLLAGVRFLGSSPQMVEGIFDNFVHEARKKEEDLKGVVCREIGAHLG